MRRTLVTAILERVAKKMGVTIHIEPEWGHVGYVRLKDGRTRFFRNTNFDLNGQGASEIARDKAYTASLMRQMGYPVVVGRAFYTAAWCKAIGSERDPSAALEYAERLGFPVIVKPNTKSKGRGVTKAGNRRELLQAIRAIEAYDRIYLVERVAKGRDYRLVVLDGAVLSAYERQPLTVTGDGHSTVLGLLRKLQAHFHRIGRDTTLDVHDPRIEMELKRLGKSLRSVPAKGLALVLLPCANLSTGGEAVDVTETLHPKWRELAAKIARDMNLRYIGIDVMSEVPLDQPPSSRYVVLEINSAPGLDNYALIGKRQQEIVEELYTKVFKALLK